MFCMNCGKQLNDTDRFCTNCGKPVEDIESVQSPQPQAAKEQKAAEQQRKPRSTNPTLFAEQETQKQEPQAQLRKEETSQSQEKQTQPQSQGFQPTVQAQQAPQPTRPQQPSQPQPVYPQQPQPVYPQQPQPIQNPVQQNTGRPIPQPQIIETKKPTDKSKTPLIVGILAVIAFIAAIVIAGFSTNWFGLTGPKVEGVSPKTTVNEYSWDELSKISDAIANAENDETAMTLAFIYHIAGPNGKLDGTQTKDIELKNGTQTSAMIIGFRHDDRPGGGKAGITFQFTSSPYANSMNSANTNEGGWSKSTLRQWLNSTFADELPGDLCDVIVKVDKKTNNKGQASSADCVNTTTDSLWLLSACEVLGGSQITKNAEIIGAEGSQYQLFSDSGVKPETANPVLDHIYTGEPQNKEWIIPNSPSSWWTRTAWPESSQDFIYVDYHSFYSDYHTSAEQPVVVAPGFCL